MSIHQPGEASALSTATRARMEVGRAVGTLAREHFPGGVSAFTVGVSNEAAAARTLELMNSGAEVIFEATFLAEGMLARADVLVRESDGWHLIEVKSSSEYKPKEHLQDVGYQAVVLEASDVDLVRISVMHLRKGYEWAGGEHDLAKLFALTEVTTDVVEMLDSFALAAKEFESLWSATEYPTANGRPPHFDPGIRPVCRDCPFGGHCFDRAPKDHIFYLNLHHSRVKKLKQQGVELIRDVPADFITDSKERLRYEAFLSGTPQIDAELRARLAEIRFPALLIDFEAARPAVPIVVGTGPYQLLPFQWSCHTLNSPPIGRPISIEEGHTEFLYEGREDPREDFARTLHERLKDGGSILHYSAYERSTIKDLAARGVPYADELESMLERRGLDLEVIVKECYADARFGGRTSIKAVLPVIAPDLSYDGLAIHDGDQAQMEFMRAMEPGCPEETRRKIFNGLREYCKLDTWAMVRLLEGLYAVAS